MSSKHKRAEPATPIVTSDAVQRDARMARRKRQAAVLAGLAVVFIGVVLYAAFGPRFWLQPANNGTQSAHDRQLVAAINAAKDQVASAKTPAEKGQANQTLGVAYLAANQANNAIDAYKAAITVDSSTKTAVLDQLGYAYAKAGQRDEAIATYQELIRLLQAQAKPADHVANTYGGSGIEKYQQYIETLQHGGSL